MSEYGVSWTEIDERWTLHQVMLFMRRIIERREAQTGKTKPTRQAREISLDELKNTDFMKG